jgi:hypothetical protein
MIASSFTDAQHHPNTAAGSLHTNCNVAELGSSHGADRVIAPLEIPYWVKQISLCGNIWKKELVVWCHMYYYWYIMT